MSTTARLLKLALQHPGRLAWFIGAGLANAGVNAAQPWLLREALGVLIACAPREWMHDYLGLKSPNRAMLLILGVFSVVLFLRCLTNYINRYLEGWLTHRIVLGVQANLADRLLQQDMEFFKKERSGELLSRLTNDIMMFRGCLKLLCALATEPLLLLVLLASTFFMNWRLTLLGLIAAPVGAAIITNLSRKMRKAAKRALEKRADMTSSMVQFIGGIRIVKAFNCEEYESRQFKLENNRLFNVLMKYERARALVRPVVELVSGLGMLLILYLGSEWCFSHKIQPEDIGGFLVALAAMYNPAKDLSKANTELQEALPGAERVFEVMDRGQQVVDGLAELTEFREAIRLERVCFEYVPGTPVLRELDLEIRKGERVALVGPSGAGKSTLTDLVLRFFDPNAGRITIDGRDLRELTFRSLREKIALVSQDPFLFNAPIRDNIAYGRADADPELVERAARAANIHDAILAQAAGYDTVVGERGDNLSGGQRQRVAIARAIFKNAPILILDEATSSLDSESENAVQLALDRLMEGRTSIVIAHRLSTIRHADRIVVLEEGRITAVGTHDELMSGSPTYARLVQLQTGGILG